MRVQIETMYDGVEELRVGLIPESDNDETLLYLLSEKLPNTVRITMSNRDEECGVTHFIIASCRKISPAVQRAVKNLSKGK